MKCNLKGLFSQQIKRIWGQRLDIAKGVLAVITAFGTVATFCTIKEMQKDRDAAYMPSILVNPTEYCEISWDAEGRVESVWRLEHEKKSDTEIDETGSVAETVTIPITLLVDDLEKFSAVNVGVGTAKNVVFEWSDDNIQRLVDYLVACDPTKKDLCIEGESVVFSLGDEIVATNKPQGFRLMYMISDAQETYTLTIPSAYSILIHEIIKTPELKELMPMIFLKVEYADIQDKNFQDVFCIAVKRISYGSNVDGSGSAIYQLVPLFAET